MNRKIDKLYQARDNINLEIEKLQLACKHKNKKSQYIIGIPGRTGYYNVCTKCDKILEYDEAKNAIEFKWDNYGNS